MIKARRRYTLLIAHELLREVEAVSYKGTMKHNKR